MWRCLRCLFKLTAATTSVELTRIYDVPSIPLILYVRLLLSFESLRLNLLGRQKVILSSSSDARVVVHPPSLMD